MYFKHVSFLGILVTNWQFLFMKTTLFPMGMKFLFSFGKWKLCKIRLSKR